MHKSIYYSNIWTVHNNCNENVMLWQVFPQFYLWFVHVELLNLSVQHGYVLAHAPLTSDGDIPSFLWRTEICPTQLPISEKTYHFKLGS